MQNPFEDANGENVNLLDVELVVDGDSGEDVDGRKELNMYCTKAIV